MLQRRPRPSRPHWRHSVELAPQAIGDAVNKIEDSRLRSIGYRSYRDLLLSGVGSLALVALVIALLPIGPLRTVQIAPTGMSLCLSFSGRVFFAVQRVRVSRSGHLYIGDNNPTGVIRHGESPSNGPR